VKDINTKCQTQDISVSDILYYNVLLCYIIHHIPLTEYVINTATSMIRYDTRV